MGSSRRIPLVIAIVGVIALGVTYFVYVRQQTNYYSGRNLRILARASEQIDGAIADRQDRVRSFAKDYDIPSSTDRVCQVPHPQEQEGELVIGAEYGWAQVDIGGHTSV